MMTTSPGLLADACLSRLQLVESMKAAQSHSSAADAAHPKVGTVPTAQRPPAASLAAGAERPRAISSVNMLMLAKLAALKEVAMDMAEAGHDVVEARVSRTSLQPRVKLAPTARLARMVAEHRAMGGERITGQDGRHYHRASTTLDVGGIGVRVYWDTEETAGVAQ